MKKNFMYRLGKICILTALIVPLSVFGQDFRLRDVVKTKKLYVELEEAVGTNNNYFLKPREEKSNEVNMFARFEVLNTVYFNQKISSIVGSSQFRHLGFDGEIGTVLFKSIDIYYRHFSGHSLDYRQSKRRFPQDNSIGIRFHLLQ